MGTTEHLIRSCWEYYAFEDAIFLSELYFSEKKNDLAAFLLATSYFRNGQYTGTYQFLKSFGTRTAETKFLFAKCCEHLNKLTEAEDVLSEWNVESSTSNSNQSMISNESETVSPFAYALLGRIFNKTNRSSQSVTQHRSAVTKLPFLLESFKAIRNSGGDDEASSYFDSAALAAAAAVAYEKSKVESTPDACFNTVVSTRTFRTIAQSNISCVSRTSTPEIMITPIDTPPAAVGGGGAVAQANAAAVGEQNGASASNCKTPYLNSASTMSDSKLVPKAPTKNLARRAQNSSRIVTRQQSQREVLTQHQSKIATRRSTRLFQNNAKENENGITSIRNEKLNAAKISVVKKAATRTRKTESETLVGNFEMNKAKRSSQVEATPENEVASTPPMNSAASNFEDAIPMKQEDDCVFEGLLKFAEIETALSRYDSNRAIDLVQDLMECHRSSPLGLLALARAYFEQANYHKADDCFREIRRIHGYFIKGMEFYSTALWHLQKDTDLSALSQELTEEHRNAPESWCSAGNCFSLQKDNDTAIKFFQRAIQLNPDFAYAYTLLGHEYVAIEAYEQALQCFRAALRLQPRHYNAWYGLGLIYYKQEKLGLARLHLRRALEINPRNSVLMCHVSLVQQGLEDRRGALKLLDEALALSPRNALCRYHRAHLLFAQERHDEALTELTELKQLAPKEPMVYFLAGKVYKKIGEPHLALMNFSWATELDPRGEQHHPVVGDRRYDEEPVTALAAMDPDEPSEMQTMDSDDSS